MKSTHIYSIGVFLLLSIFSSHAFGWSISCGRFAGFYSPNNQNDFPEACVGLSSPTLDKEIFKSLVTGANASDLCYAETECKAQDHQLDCHRVMKSSELSWEDHFRYFEEKNGSLKSHEVFPKQTIIKTRTHSYIDSRNRLYQVKIDLISEDLSVHSETATFPLDECKTKE